MSSIEITTSPVAISLRKVASIMVWKVAGELVSPKNITVGSKSPLFVLKAAFHWSPSLMQILLYPHRTSNLVNHCFLMSWVTSFLMSGRGMYSGLYDCLADDSLVL